jgi:hypothetical protein
MNWNDPTERLELIERVGAIEYSRLLREHEAAAAIEHVNGHAISRVASRFGPLFHVGGTNNAFKSLAQAREFAQRTK